MKILKKVLAISCIATILGNTTIPIFAESNDNGIIMSGADSKSIFKSSFESSQISYEVNKEEQESDDNSLFTQEYKDYLKLSDDEKKSVEVIPRKYEVQFDSFFEDLKDKESNNIELNKEEIIDEQNHLLEDINTNSKIAKNSNSVIAKSNTDSNEENNENTSNTELPKAFNLKDKIDIRVENQGSYGLCWDFASLKSLETYLSINGYGDYDFSELHLDYLTSSEFGGYRSLHDGGNFEEFEKYMVEEKGPAYEEEVPYQANYNIDNYEYLLSLEKKAYVDETVKLPSIYKYRDENDNLIYSKRYLYKTEGNILNYNEEDIISSEQVEYYRNYVKNHIMKNGGLYCNIAPPDQGTQYFNSITNSEYFDGDFNKLERNGFHAVTIVGWDDDYSKDNFNEELRPKNDGAYIILNSWGENYGNQGYYYVSYDDAYIETEISGIKSASIEKDLTNYINISFEDLNLYNALKEQLGENSIVFDDDKLEISLSSILLDSIQVLNLSGKGIKNTEGLEKFTQVYNLNLSENEIEDINVDKLINLRFLDLSKNLINQIDLSGLEQLTYLNISDNQISNINYINSLTNLQRLLAKNNNIETFPNLNENVYYYYIDLSGNENIDLNQTNIENVNELVLSNCNLLELPTTSVYSLNLSDNRNLDLSTINLEYTKELNLSNCNIDNEKINDMQNSEGLEKLTLSNNPIDVLDFINKFKLHALDISNTNIIDLSAIEDNESAENLTNLNVSGNKNLSGINVLTNITELYLNDCDISDLTSFNNLNNLSILSLNNNNITNLEELIDTNIRYLYLNNNKNIELSSLKDINSLYGVSLENCGITDILDIISNLTLNSINLNNNNIENINVLGEIEDRSMYLELSNNRIKSIPNYDNHKISLILKNQNIEENYELQVGKTNYIDFSNIMNETYNERFKTSVDFQCENCELDFNNRFIKVYSNIEGLGQAKIKVIGGFYDGYSFTINYDMTNNIQKVGIEAEFTGRVLYLEGENFDSTNLKVYVIYENGLMEEIENYELEDNLNLEAGQESVKIKYENFESNIDIYVYDSETTKKIKFNDPGIYNSFILSTYDYESGLINKNDKNMEIILTKELCDSVKDITITDKVSDLTGISEFSNLERLVIEDYNSDDLTEIIKLQNLRYLSINNNENEDMQIEDISLLNSLINLKTLILWNTKIKQTNNIYERLGLEQLNISSIYELNELENEDNIVYLPEYYGELLGICENPNVQVSFNCNMDEAEVKIDENQKYYVELDNKEYEDYLSDSREAYIRLLDINKGIDVSILISYITNDDIDNPDNPVTPDNPDIPSAQDYIYSTIKNLGYQIKDSLIIDVKSKTNIETFIEKLIGEKIIDVVILDKDDNELNNDTTYIGTGMKLRFKNENSEFILDETNMPLTYTITVKGDIDGDGIAGDIDALYLKAYRNELQGYVFTEEQIEATDINSDSLINYIDSNLLKLHRLEVEGYSLDY